MSKAEHSGFGNLTWTAPVNPKPNPGGQPTSAATNQTFGQWVTRDREWKENGAMSVPKYS